MGRILLVLTGGLAIFIAFLILLGGSGSSIRRFKTTEREFDDIAIENSNLRREVEYLMNHIKVAREERDELIRTTKKA